MAGLSWFPVDVNLRSHRKTLKLAAALADPRAHTWLEDVWSWAYSSLPSGTIRGEDAGRIIEMAVGWTGEADRLWKAMVAAGWLDRLEDGLAIHDWAEHAGPLIAKAERDAERSRERRERMRGRFASAGRRADVAQTPDGRPGDVSGNSNPNPNPNPNLLPSEGEEGGAQVDHDPPNTPPRSAADQLHLVGETEPTSSATPEGLRGLWNGLKAPEQPEWRADAKTRQKPAQARLRERPLHGPDGWDAVIRRIAASPFCRGQNDRGWVAGPDFLLRPDTAAKALEGQYDARPAGSAAPPQRGRSIAPQQPSDWSTRESRIHDEPAF